jgi:hypothetical protein
VDPDGQPVPGFHLGVGDRELTTDKEGRFRAEGLVPGLEVRVGNFENGPFASLAGASTTVEPGKNKDVGDLKAKN